MRASLIVFLFSLGLAFFWMSSCQEGAALIRNPWRAATPTPDRLAMPSLPDAPSQADYGAQQYWHYCMPCHGDFGQGLTAEFISIWPASHQDCWKAGCHGEKPYQGGFSIPRDITPVIHSGKLAHFKNAAALYEYIHSTMPYQSLFENMDETYWQLVAFLLRENGYRSEDEINVANAADISLGDESPGNTGMSNFWIFAPIVIICVAGFVLLRKRFTRK